jgi:hypothetical protein
MMKINRREREPAAADETQLATQHPTDHLR